MKRIEALKCEVEKETLDDAREAREAETAKSEAEAKIEHERQTQRKEEREVEERQCKEDRNAAEWHDQLLCDMEKAKLGLEQERINSQQFQKQRDYEFKCQLQEKQLEDELEKLEAPKLLTQPKETIKAKSPRITAFNEGKDEMDSYLLRFEKYATAQKWEPDTWATGLSALLQGIRCLCIDAEGGCLKQ